MKTKLLCFAVTLFLTGSFLSAQKPFTQILNAKFTVNAEWKIISQDRSRVLAGDLEDIAMFGTLDGKELWHLNFKEKYNKKTCKDWNWLEDKGLIKIIFKGDNKEEVKIYYLDDQSLQAVDDEKSRINKPQPSKMASKGTLVLENPKVKINASYEHKLMTSAKNGADRKIKITCTGDYNWSAEFEGKLVASLCDNSLGYASTFFGNQLNLMAQDNRVFAIYEGLTCIDIKSGKILWQTTFDNSSFDFGMLKSTQTVGRADFPLVTDNAIYIADLSKGNYCLKRLNPETGALIWKSQEVDNKAVIPQLSIVGKVLLARFGGEIITQSNITNPNTSATVCKTELKMTGDFGIKAFDIETGKTLWETSVLKPLGDKFSSSISNMINDDKLVYASSDKNLLAFDALSGKVVHSVDIKSLGIGEPYHIEWYKGDILVEAREGVARVKPDCTKLFSTDTGKCLATQFEGDAYFVWTGKEPGDLNKFIRLDLTNGTILGKMEDTYRPWFTADGEEFVKFDGAKILRFKTR